MAHILTDQPPGRAVKWHVGIAGGDRFDIEAAAIVHEYASEASPSSVRRPDSHNDVMLTSFEDPEGGIVLQVPTLSVTYIHRAPAGQP